MGSPTPAQLEFKVATRADLAEVVAVLNDASAWLRSRGIQQWPRRFPPEFVSPAVEAGQTWLIRVDGRTAGTVTIDDADPAWADLPAKALIVHRLAVRRGFSGLGQQILTWAVSRARDLSYEFLRLDCVAHNPDLIRYYETRGFTRRGEVLVGGAPGQRDPDLARQTKVLRFELALAAD